MYNKDLTPSVDLVIGGVPRFKAEAPWAWRLLRRWARELACRGSTETPGRRPQVADAAGDSSIVLVEADPEAYLLPEAAHRLLSSLADRSEADVVIPVSNEPWTEEARADPPFAYLTPTLLEEAVRLLAARAVELRAASSPQSPVFAVRRRVLASLSPELPLDQVPQHAHRAGFRVMIDPGSYLHRYGPMNRQARQDLAARVPQGARAVLDVGCSQGGTARALRDRGVARVVGIEPEAADAEVASIAYDRVLPVRLDQVREDFTGEFDAILFGDVLEHLSAPAEALLRVRPWLTPEGVVIASVPNAGHWAIISDLLEGRFEYVPYSLLSGTHLRFFTRRTLSDLFEACGYRIETIDKVSFPPSPEGEAKLARLSSYPGASEDLCVAEFLAVAEAR